MQKRTFAIVIMGLVALVVIASLTGIFQQTDYMSRDYPEVNIPADKVHTLTITTLEHSIVLKRSGEDWRMTEPLDSSVEFPPVRSLLRQLENMELEKAVTAEKNRYPDFGVSEDVGRRLLIEWEGGQQKLMVAGQGEEFQGDYVVVGSDPRVFYLARRLGLNDDPRSWRDKRISVIEPDEIQSISIKGGGRDYTVERSAGAYRFASGEAVDSTSASRLFMQYAMLRADDFDDEVAAVTVAGKPSVTVTIRHGNAESVVYYRDATLHYLVARKGSPTVFQLAPGRLGALAPLRSDLTPG